MAKRERSKTRADMIAMLKSRGVRGRLSKMTKAQLRTKLDETAPPPEDQEGDGRKPQRSGELELEADPQSGGHFYKADGSTSATQEAKYKHEHRKKDWPAQKGSGSSYKSFMTKEMKQNGGNMAKAAAAYRDQKGGHLVRKDGTVGAAESTKYKHTHTGENPATDSTKAPASATAKASGSTTKAKQARAERAAEQNKPKPSPKPVPKPSPRRAPKPARKKRATASDDIFDTDEQKAAKEKARKAAQKEAEKAGARKTRRRQAKDAAEKQAADKQATERREAVKSRKAKTSDANSEKQRKAKARLKEGKSGNVFFKYRDEALACWQGYRTEDGTGVRRARRHVHAVRLARGRRHDRTRIRLLWHTPATPRLGQTRAGRNGRLGATMGAWRAAPPRLRPQVQHTH